MEGGNLSNAIVHRWMVTLDVLTGGQPLPRKRMWNSWETIARETPLDSLVLGVLWKVAERHHVILEAAYFDMPHEYGVALENYLDRKGAHPIKWVSPYLDREALRSTLVFRPEVMFVLDTPEHAWFWGRYAMSTRDLSILA